MFVLRQALLPSRSLRRASRGGNIEKGRTGVHVERSQVISREYAAYESAERKRALHRVLARSLVDQLRKAGHTGRDLLSLTNHLVQAISDEDFAPVGTSAGPTPSAPLSHNRVAGAGSANVGTVVLRPAELADRELLETWAAEPLVQRSLALWTLREVLGSLGGGDEAGRMAFIGCEAKSQTPFGLFVLSHVDSEVGQAELTKLVGGPEFRGRGLAALATRRLLEYGFEEVGLNRIYLRTLGGNLKNIRLNERLGFRFEGVLVQAHRGDQGLCDVILMGLLRDWFDSPARSNP